MYLPLGITEMIGFVMSFIYHFRELLILLLIINYFMSSGKCFMDIAEEMKEVYAVYCRNHDDAISLMEKVLLMVNR